MRSVTISQYLGEKTNIPQINSIPLHSFFEEFGEMNPQEMLQFINDSSNSYDIGKFVYYYYNWEKIYAFNGRIHALLANGVHYKRTI